MTVSKVYVFVSKCVDLSISLYLFVCIYVCMSLSA